MLGIPIGGQKSGGITAGTHGVISVIKLGMLGIPVGGQQSGGGGITAGTRGIISVSKLEQFSVESASTRSISV